MLGIDNTLLFGAAFAGMGSIVLVGAFRELARAVDSKDWPKVPGEIEETGVLSDLSEGSVTYAPEVRYHYRVGDNQYVSDRIAFGGKVSMSFRAWAEGIVERYRKCRNVSVSVSPAKPDLCVLEPGVHWSCWFILLMGAVFTGFGIRQVLTYLGVFG